MNLASAHRNNFGRTLLSQLVAARTYAETKPDGRKETHAENVERVVAMHVKRFPRHEDLIREAFGFVHKKIVVPSMRIFQFAGEAIERSQMRSYNCTFLNITSFKDFADALWLSMNGCGVGYSVQWHHISGLPTISGGNPTETMVIPDTKEGWADSILRLLMNPQIRFDYSLIRDADSPLSTGGTASGPKPLHDAHQLIRRILKLACGRRLSSLEVHDIMCHQADAVVVGGVRRAALICLFDVQDNEMLTCKSGHDWRKTNKQRERANNSAVLYRKDPLLNEQLASLLEMTYRAQSGDPGLFITNDVERNLGGNPCFEISLHSRGACNLSEINVAACTSVEDFIKASQAATVIGTLQATLTDFNYIHSDWKHNIEREALLGVSLTGQAENWQLIADPAVLRAGAAAMLGTNESVARLLGINLAARIGCTKPSGSTSVYLGTTSGIHSAYADWFLRRVQIEKSSPLAGYLVDKFGLRDPNDGGIVEHSMQKESVLTIAAPHAAPHAIVSTRESAIQLLERGRHVKENWIKPSHRSGLDYHNVSLTVSYSPDEQNGIIDWVQRNADSVSGVSFFPRDGGTHKNLQMPFEAISKEAFCSWSEKFEEIKIDLTEIDFSRHADERHQEAACGAGGCEVT